MTLKIKAANRTAQLNYRGAGNPSSVLPRSAISNCFPGLETDFRNLWRRTFEGIVLLENNNYVIEAERAEYEFLVGRRLLKIDGHDTVVRTTGPIMPDRADVALGSKANPDAVSFMEWSNSIARILHKQGMAVTCTFTGTTPDPDKPDLLEYPSDWDNVIVVDLIMRRFLDGDSAAISPQMISPGDLTQGLCSPWQNDYRECACYYWAASRPDFVNIEPGANGLSEGDQWMSKTRGGGYMPDNTRDARLLSYDDLFGAWEHALKFIVRGKDVI